MEIDCFIRVSVDVGQSENFGAIIRFNGEKDRADQVRVAFHPAQFSPKALHLKLNDRDHPMALKMHHSLAPHAGEWLNTEVVRPYKSTLKNLAVQLQVSRQALSSLLNGHSGLTVEMAVRFEQAFGINADTLMRMQAAHDVGMRRASQEGFERHQAGGEKWDQ
jgi:addiction module HigA family antidote